MPEENESFDNPATASEAVIRILGREDILGAPDLANQLVDVPEWGGSVYVRTIRGSERDQYEQSLTERKGKTVEVNMRNARAKLVALAAVDSEGKRIFSNSDIALLGEKSAVALDRVYGVASKLAGLSEKDVEELVGNSDGDRSDASTSD